MSKQCLACLTVVFLLCFSTVAFSATGNEYKGFVENLLVKDSRNWMVFSYTKGTAKITNYWKSNSGLKEKITVEFSVRDSEGKSYTAGARIQILDGEFSCMNYQGAIYGGQFKKCD